MIHFAEATRSSTTLNSEPSTQSNCKLHGVGYAPSLVPLLGAALPGKLTHFTPLASPPSRLPSLPLCQVDLSREAANLERFNTNFRRTRSVSFPEPLYPLVSPDVLVESFEAGRHIRYAVTAAAAAGTAAKQ